MIEALKKYVCLIRPLKTTWRQQFWKTEPLESCIFVPREIAESQQCGGLRLRENISVVFTSDFCDKPFGKKGSHHNIRTVQANRTIMIV